MPPERPRRRPPNERPSMGFSTAITVVKQGNAFYSFARGDFCPSERGHKGRNSPGEVMQQRALRPDRQFDEETVRQKINNRA